MHIVAAILLGLIVIGHGWKDFSNGRGVLTLVAGCVVAVMLVVIALHA